MSAQSSARSKRRQSALFSSKSLLPLPQFSISSIATSTPARANQRHTPAPLPTPQPPNARLLGTPARQHDDNTTFFGFSPGAEADETALLAVDYRSLGRGDEQQQEDLFDDTAILEERAFANRRTSHEGDQSSGGLGALIFSNLIAGSQAHDALERLELGKRRDSDTTRRIEHVSPLKRNASFTISTGGEYLVDYETDVRFGDDLQDLYHETAEASPPNEHIFLNPPPPSFHFSSSPVADVHALINPQGLHVPPYHPIESNPTQNAIQNQFASSPFRNTSKHSQQDPSNILGCPLKEQTVGGHAEQVEDAPQYNPADVQPSPCRQPLPSPAVSPASDHFAVSDLAEPSPLPSMAEKRLARRMRRGLTSSMAILLSPVAEDRDREKSLSRSRSMLIEAIEAQGADLPPVGASRSLTISPHPGLTRSSLEDAVPPANVSAYTPMQQEVPNGEEVEYRAEEKQVSTTAGKSFTEPIPLASVIAASLSQRSGLSRSASIPSPDVTSAAPSASVASEAGLASLALLSKDPIKHRMHKQPASKATEKVLSQKNVAKVSRSASEGPSYLKPTLSRSIQQREAVPFQRSTSTSSARPSGTSAPLRRTASDTVARNIRQASEASTSRQPRQPPASRSRVVSTPVDSLVPVPPAPIAKKRSVDDLFERRQRDAAQTVSASEARDNGKGKGKETDTLLPHHQRLPAAGKHTTSQALTENVHKGFQDETLTVPRGFAFGSSQREGSRKRSRSDLDTAHTVAPVPPKRVPQRATRQELQSAPIRKARRVLPEENERLDGSDPEIGASVPLTSAALAAQEYTLDARQSLEEDEAPQSGPSESFDRTTHSQMLQRYLRELAAIEISYTAESKHGKPTHSNQTAGGSHEVQHASGIDAAGPAVIPKSAEQASKRLRLDKDPIQKQTTSRRAPPHREPLRFVSARPPLQHVQATTANQAQARAPLSVADLAKGRPKPTAPIYKPANMIAAPKVTDFTFQVVGQQQTSFQERLAAWQAREAEAARSGKPMLQPLALPPKDKAKQARKADKPETLKKKQPVQAKEFSWASDKRAKERKDWEERLREKEQILAELAEIRRLEAEAAEMEAVRKMRAAQIPVAHAVPSFIKSRRRA